MTHAKTYSWILMALGKASSDKPVRLKSLEQVADFINHSRPTITEVKQSINWLKEKDLVENSGVKYNLTEKGRSIYKSIFNNPSSLSKQWDILTNELMNLGADNITNIDPGTFLPK